MADPYEGANVAGGDCGHRVSNPNASGSSQTCLLCGVHTMKWVGGPLAPSPEEPAQAP